MSKQQTAISAGEVAPPAEEGLYPEPFSSTTKGQVCRHLGDVFGLKNFGVNLTRLPPGCMSSLFHHHTKQDEFIYVLEGQPTLVTDEGEEILKPGMCSGFASNGISHQLANRSDEDVVYLEIGDRSAGDEVYYPRIDMKKTFGSDGKLCYRHDDGTPY